MQIQKIFKAGNSNVVAIPKNYARQLGLKSGQEVAIDVDPNRDMLTVQKSSPKAGKKKKTAVDREFEEWLDKVSEQEKETIIALAKA